MDEPRYNLIGCLLLPLLILAWFLWREHERRVLFKPYRCMGGMDG